MEILLSQYLKITYPEIPAPTLEHRFCREYIDVNSKEGIRNQLSQLGIKDWRFDLAWPDVKLAVECEGGGWSNGRHTRGQGFSNDLRKYAFAMRQGWFVYRCDRAMIDSAMAMDDIAVIYARQFLIHQPPSPISPIEIIGK